jgi:hypothetical protein
MDLTQRHELYERYLLGQCDEAERTALEAMLATDPGIVQEFREHEELIHLMQGLSKLEAFRQSVRARRGMAPTATQAPLRITPLYRVLALAASLALLIIAGWWWMQSGKDTPPDALYTLEEPPTDLTIPPADIPTDTTEFVAPPQAPPSSRPPSGKSRSRPLYASLELRSDLGIRSTTDQPGPPLTLTVHVLPLEPVSGQPLGTLLTRAQNALLAGAHADALKEYEAARDLMLSLKDVPPATYAIVLHNMALAYESMGDLLRVAPLYQEAKGLLAEASPATTASHLPVLVANQAAHYHRLGNTRRAETLYQEARVALTPLAASQPDLLRAVLFNLARLYADTDRAEAAEALRSEAAGLKQ